MADTDSHDLTEGRTTPRPDPTELADRAIAKLKEQLEQYIDGKYEVLAERMEGHWRLG